MPTLKELASLRYLSMPLWKRGAVPPPGRNGGVELRTVLELLSVEHHADIISDDLSIGAQMPDGPSAGWILEDLIEYHQVDWSIRNHFIVLRRREHDASRWEDHLALTTHKGSVP